MQGLAELQSKLAQIVLGLKKTEPEMLPGERVDEAQGAPADSWGASGGGWGGGDGGGGGNTSGWGSSSPNRAGGASAWGSGGGWSSPAAPAAAGWNV
jgi:hypothetical protein